MNNSLGYIDISNQIGQFIPSYTQPQAENGISGQYSNLPCIADYSGLSGTAEKIEYSSLPGDNVCNGELGLLKDKTFVCPYYKPICKGYRCGATLGTCDYSQ